jgi:hypothetical protein
MSDTVKQARAGRRFRLQGYQLDEHPRAMLAIVLFIVLAAYAFIDTFLTASSGYLGAPPYWLFVSGGATVGGGVLLWLYRGAVPRTEAAGVAALLAIAAAGAIYPGWLRINDLLGEGAYVRHPYRLEAGLTLHPADAALPSLSAPLDAEYWRAQDVGGQWDIEIRQGWLGQWMYRRQSLQDRIDGDYARGAFMEGIVQGQTVPGKSPLPR